jgi:putative aldouronate transport system substrate-binding protein
VIGTHGGGYPGINQMKLSPERQKIEDDLTNPTGLSWNQQYRIPDAVDITKLFPEEVWPDFSFTADEMKELSVLTADMNTYVGEMQDKFITGMANLDADWNTYVQNIEKMGLKRYLEIKQSQYNRYKNG